MRALAICTLLALLECVSLAQTTTAITRPRRQRQEPKTMFVAPTGDDANPGTQEQPFKTIQRGTESVGPGDTLIIAGGVYKEWVQVQRGGFYLGRPLTIKAADKEQVIIDVADVPARGWGAFDTNGNDYLIISGITVQNSPNCGIVVNRSWQVTLENCRTINTGTTGIMIDKSGMVNVRDSEVERACQRGGEESISVKRSQDVTIEDSYIHHTGHEGIDVKEGSKHVRILRNRLHDVQRQALYAEAWDSPTHDIRFEGNIVYDSLFGIAAGSECGGELSDIVIANNIVYNCRGPGIILADWGAERYSHPVRNVQIIHNTVVGNGVVNGWGGGIVFENKEAREILVANNIVSQNPTGEFRVSGGKLPASYTVTGNLITGDSHQFPGNTVGQPQFFNAKFGDFRLQPGSLGIDAATALPGVEKDFSGQPRLQGKAPDLGALEARP